MASRHYTDPLCRSFRESNYVEANEILERHIASNEPFTNSQSYYGLTHECKDLDITWKALQHFHLFTKDNGLGKPTYYKYLRDVDSLKGGSKRIRFILNQTIAKDTKPPEKLLDHLLPFFYTDEQNDVRKEAVNRNITLRLISLGANPNVIVSEYRHQGRNMLEKIINNKDDKMFDVIANNDLSCIFHNEEGIDAIELLAQSGLLESWLEKRIPQMSPEQETHYRSYLLLDLIKSSENASEEPNVEE